MKGKCYCKQNSTKDKTICQHHLSKRKSMYLSRLLQPSTIVLMKIPQNNNIPLVGEYHQCCHSRPWRKPGNCGALAAVSRRSIVLPKPPHLTRREQPHALQTPDFLHILLTRG